MVDRTLLGLVNRNVALPLTAEGMLEDGARRALAAAIIARIEESGERYEGKQRTLREIIQNQARHVATYLRRDRDAHTGFVARW